MVLAGEQSQRTIAKELMGDNLVAEAAPMSFGLKEGGEEIRAAPFAYTPDLVAKVIQLLEQNMKKLEMFLKNLFRW